MEYMVLIHMLRKYGDIIQMDFKLYLIRLYKDF
uniref:Uncharacterized protein n=1 Tax=CrAss-like virus sp. ctYsL76 TaxID=2826826 RepID=A0A8S5QMF1_9CAUD|nr:MAG TPA: hypothetical protein [CrAss-like virus sp. ctYsL76]